MITSRRVRWTGNIARMGKEECIQGFLGEKARKKHTTRNA
jgi:hypothetical protein